MPMFQRFLSDRQGATAIEYGLIGSIIAVAIIGGFGAMSKELTNVFNTVTNALVTHGQ
ncbi:MULTISPECIES: Flp family type IVb pilin [unclassified Rhizobium]|uniref:Flp family type IVb pilin n=1 Tax=unclassified Rhizobium TaxID=2613769 RepID=UPI00078971C1|nr:MULTISPECIES: Flp family type IVb pilin [unclassified Rhizobium]TCM48718.1 pilus assembly protein Flp/PilA [Rhizobium sp. PP-F2F-G48]